jgi:hypothetical protein
MGSNRRGAANAAETNEAECLAGPRNGSADSPSRLMASVTVGSTASAFLNASLSSASLKG